MTNFIALTNANINSGFPVYLLSPNFTYSWKNMYATEPRNNGFGSVEAQYSGWENPLMNLTFFIPTDLISSTTGLIVIDSKVFMTMDLLNQFTKHKPDGNLLNDTYLQLTLGDDATPFVFKDYSASTSSTGVSLIPTVIKSYSVNVSADDSRKGQTLVVSVQMQVTG